MATTTNKGLRYPTLADNPDIPRDLQNLATDLDNIANHYRGTLATRNAFAAKSGDIWWTTDDLTMGAAGTPYVYTGGAWRILAPAANPAATVAGSRTLGVGATEAAAGNDMRFSPVGALLDYGGVNDPPETNWLIADGRVISRTTYTVLFARYGTRFGAGDGSTTFAIPDCRGKFVAGAISGGTAAGSAANDNTHYQGTIAATGGEVNHTISIAEMPSHDHGEVVQNGGTTQATIQGPASSLLDGIYGSNQRTQPTGGGGAHNNIPPVIALNKIVRVL